MNVASLELCKELYGLSGWRERVGLQYFPDKFYATHLRLDLEEEVIPTMDESYEADFICPAYDLGYLLRKLPRTYKGVGLCVWAAGSSRWRAEYDNSHRVHFDADTPEDAAAKLATELFKQGILKREES